MKYSPGQVYYVDVLPDGNSRKKRTLSIDSSSELGRSVSSDSVGMTKSTHGSTQSLCSDEECDDTTSQRSSSKIQKVDGGFIPRVQSSPGVNAKAEEDFEENRLIKVTSMPDLSKQNSKTEIQMIEPFENKNPVDLVRDIITSHGYKSDIIPSLSVEKFFEEITSEHIQGYDTDMTDAIRSENVPRLRQLRAEGRQMQCCNRFGESTMHMACRRGSYPVVRFLMEECGCSIRLRDDFGRTPLHDACWTVQIEFEVMKMLIQAEPHMLLTSDKRGHTPLDYVRREDWSAWCGFFLDNRELLIPKDILKKTCEEGNTF